MVSTEINKLIMEAMKSHDKVASETYKLVKAKILEFKTQKNAPEYTDEAEIKLLQKMVKERKETATIYKTNGRDDLASAELAQADVIEKLLPATPTEEDVVKYVFEKYPDGIDKKQMGVVIKEVKSALVGVDGSIVANIVKSRLV
jgi:uncharacterized protein YqeY